VRTRWLRDDAAFSDAHAGLYDTTEETIMKKWLPLLITAFFALWVGSKMRPPKDAPGEFPTVEFGRLPIVEGGRAQPMDALARNALLQMRGKQTLNTEPWKGNYSNPKILSAVEWMLEVMMDPATADTRPAFRIDHSDVKGLLGLPPVADEAAKTDGKHYSWSQMAPRMAALQSETQRAFRVNDSLRDAYQRALVDLWKAIRIYKSLKVALGPAAGGDLAKGIESDIAMLKKARTAFEAQMNGSTPDAEALAWFSEREDETVPLVLPPVAVRDGKAEWTRAVRDLLNIERGEQPNFALPAYAKMAAAFRAKKPDEFKSAISDYFAALKSTNIADTRIKKAANEQWFNHTELFYKGMVISVIAFLFAIVLWFSPAKNEWARKTALWLTVLTIVIVTGGLVFRMVHEGRPPVTNLYSSALFIAWGAALFGVLMEAVFPRGLGVAVASLMTFICLTVAHYLALDGDTLIMLRAVLDTNFWLATHVVIITLGYAATFVAGFMGIFYVINGVFTKNITPELNKAFYAACFAIVCFAMLFSFVGTVLGGIWADQSWGRFWGWDPKENGALLIVIWNALILHARLGGLVRERGFMILAIVGNAITAWSWFGTNMLGIGLHSYGFMDGAWYALHGFILFNLAIVLLGCVPKTAWRSFSAPSEPQAPVGASSKPA
jgi:ABC-type transport system involved in cytochrome c biogenesis permease subunit